MVMTSSSPLAHPPLTGATGPGPPLGGVPLLTLSSGCSMGRAGIPALTHSLMPGTGLPCSSGRWEGRTKATLG